MIGAKPNLGRMNAIKSIESDPIDSQDLDARSAFVFTVKQFHHERRWVKRADLASGAYPC